MQARDETGRSAAEINREFDVRQREAFRQISYIRAACVATITGHGVDGYLEAMDILIDGGTRHAD